MSLIVNPSSTIDWSLTRERLCDKALEKCSRLAPGESASVDDRNLCLEALDGILKNLMWRGYSWPKTLTSSYSLTFTSGVQSQSLPQDFYKGEQVNYVDTSGNEVSLPRATAKEWRDLILKSTQASYPDRYYIDNFNVLWIYPIPNQNLTGKLYYQRVILDSVAQSSIDLDSPWMLGIVYGIASEVGHEFGVNPQRIQMFESKWERQLQLGIMNESPPGPDRIQVND
jgi:hypothetical protein